MEHIIIIWEHKIKTSDVINGELTLIIEIGVLFCTTIKFRNELFTIPNNIIKNTLKLQNNLPITNYII